MKRFVVLFVVLVGVIVVVTCVSLHGAHKVNVTRVGDYGYGTPLSNEVDACEAAGGEMIYTPWSDSWECES